MRHIRRFLSWTGRQALSLILRVPFLLGMVAGFFALCVVAFWAGYERVYGARGEG